MLGGFWGFLAGTGVGIFGLFRHRTGWDLLLLVTGGTLFGSVGCGLSALTAAVARESLHPLLSSSLAMAGVGFFAGLCGYLTSHQPSKPTPDEPAYEEEEPAAPGVTVEWLLREPKRPWRLPRPLVRVLPVLAVVIGALVGAALVPSLALLAVAALGLAVSWVLYRQEQRLDALERRAREPRDS